MRVNDDTNHGSTMVNHDVSGTLKTNKWLMMHVVTMVCNVS